MILKMIRIITIVIKQKSAKLIKKDQLNLIAIINYFNHKSNFGRLYLKNLKFYSKFNNLVFLPKAKKKKINSKFNIFLTE